MKNRRLIFDPYDKPVFVDSLDSEKIYCMTSAEWERQNNIVEEHSNTTIPDNIMVKVYPVIKVGSSDEDTDLYDLSPDLIEFPLNRINWIWIKGV
jgi:hypothetical protein